DRVFCRRAVPKTKSAPSLHIDLAQIRKAFDFNRIAARITEEHGGLLSRLAFKSNTGWDHEVNALLSQTLRQGFPVPHGHHQAKMRHWHHVLPDQTGICDRKRLPQMQ